MEDLEEKAEKIGRVISEKPPVEGREIKKEIEEKQKRSYQREPLRRYNDRGIYKERFWSIFFFI